MKKLIYLVIVIAIVACNKKEDSNINPRVDNDSIVTTIDSSKIVRDTTNWYYRIYQNNTLVYEAYPTFTSDGEINPKVSINMPVRDSISFYSVMYTLNKSTTFIYKSEKPYLNIKFLNYVQLFGQKYQKIKGTIIKNNIKIEFKDNFI